MDQIIVNTHCDIFLICDLLHSIIVITIFNNYVNYYEVKVSNIDCCDIKNVENIINNYLHKFNKNINVYNVCLFMCNKYVCNNSRINYYATKHLFKYICNCLHINYKIIKYDTNTVVYSENKRREINITFKYANKKQKQYVIFGNNTFINLLKKIIT